MEAVFTTENRAQVRNPGQAIEAADALNSTLFTLVWERFGHEKTATYEKRDGQWGTFSFLHDEWTPVDSKGVMVHQKRVV